MDIHCRVDYISVPYTVESIVYLRFGRGVFKFPLRSYKEHLVVGGTTKLGDPAASDTYLDKGN